MEFPHQSLTRSAAKGRKLHRFNRFQHRDPLHGSKGLTGPDSSGEYVNNPEQTLLSFSMSSPSNLPASTIIQDYCSR